LCQVCALCCNGTIFADVRFTPAEAGVLRELSLVPRPARQPGRWQLPQPCPALCGKLCRVYGDRPAHCREFVCLLLARAQRGEVTLTHAHRVIRTALRYLERLERLLNQLGEPAAAKSKPIKARLDALSRQLEREEVDATAAALFSDLTQTRFQLQAHLAKHFYPGD
jgi:Fe-S-cluster containining protein